MGRPPKKRKSQDPYLVAQRERKKAANLSRQAELRQQRAEALGDPVRGITTDFVKSFDTGGLGAVYDAQQQETAAALAPPPRNNYSIRPEELDRSLERSAALAVDLPFVPPPLPPDDSAAVERNYGMRAWWGPTETEEQRVRRQADRQAKQAKEERRARVEYDAKRVRGHDTAREALRRIADLSNASARDRLRANMARCVHMFGRHQTDLVLPPKAPALTAVDATEAPPRPKTNVAAAKKRIGPDTGSSEVQVAILTAKIRAVADFLATRGKGDKHTKRHLRLLVHRRQKHLKYLQRNDRGGPRWQHCIETLGLTEGTWRGEISL